MLVRVRLWQVLALAMFLAACGTMGYMLFWPEHSLSPTERTLSAFEGWRVATLDLRADDAEKYWLGLQQYVDEHREMGQLTDEQKRTAAFVLARKYVHENDVNAAFAHLVKIPSDESSLLWDLPMFLYLAGEAMDKEWLAQYRVDADRGTLALQDLSAHANMLWADGKYKDLLEATDSVRWIDWTDGTDRRRGWQQWLRLRRAKALRALGRDEDAYAELNKSGSSPAWIRARQYPVLAECVIVEGAEFAVPVGEGAAFEEALRMVRPKYDEVTRDVSGMEFQKRIDRILQAIGSNEVGGRKGG